MDSWCTAGTRVEVILTEDGLSGSRYAGRVIELAKSRALIEFEVSPALSPMSSRAMIASLGLSSVCVAVSIAGVQR